MIVIQVANSNDGVEHVEVDHVMHPLADVLTSWICGTDNLDVDCSANTGHIWS